ncbi:MAG: acetyl-CoA carboxylase, biotin carboxyl carrier protein [Elusimicrobia bacterium CG_4_9_14_3_um_filter_62_55]|nr:MAG: acetyl-CoA carboxylase, biotin carboxyl carrier protein [Elusimicrobia bacterium CG22_combo_CG10-13_8_21_14_all_63_91]PJA12323.1 MAG: acetyl-CoA carboxylase, biotin carboxyl carrier protein [Elusimicrobia bacterium CG_4_10_14_0_2_um_filter_63_34]PJB24725.1 MAG: acetyl-CoA carboxylase, biotin carboxyl carrier protein [Elusimicrobia bacterium CG_4_9_14_3_um_filter_62_55]
MAKKKAAKQSPKAGRKAAKPSPQNGSGKAASAGGSGPLKDLQELYGFMQANGLQSLELDRKDYYVRLVRKGHATMPVGVPVAVAQGAVAAAPAAAAAPSGPPAAANAADGLPANCVEIKSPMMGVFYRASSPSSPPFVKEGDRVKPGDVLGLIEAMKVFNDVKAESAGKVVKCLLDNGKPVKVGQTMFWIEKV